MGFVNLPVKGDPVARLPEVLDQIQAALAEDRDRKVQRIGNRIEFSTDSLLRRWLFRGRFLVSSGEIEAEASSDSLMIDYRLRFFELFVVTTLAVLSSVVALAFRVGIASLRSNLYVLLSACVLGFGVTIVRATSKFSRFLRQFPREARSAH
jgi:hypothetical protein